MLRRQCSDTNENTIKRLVHVLPIWIVKSNILSVGPSTERNNKINPKSSEFTREESCVV